MYLKDVLSQYDGKKIKIFVDMDGVIADYNVGEAYNYDKKRPLISSIAKLKEISQQENVELFILSISHMNEGIEEKNQWLDKYASFFKIENRIIIAREANDFISAKTLKSDYLENLKRDDSIIIVIDDDPAVLKEIGEENQDIILLKDTVLVD